MRETISEKCHRRLRCPTIQKAGEFKFIEKHKNTSQLTSTTTSTHTVQTRRQSKEKGSSSRPSTSLQFLNKSMPKRHHQERSPKQLSTAFASSKSRTRFSQFPNRLPSACLQFHKNNPCKSQRNSSFADEISLILIKIINH